mgnify:CR=1 FL=1
MPGAGKTFFGSYAAKKLGVSFIDLDNEISEKYKVSIAHIFETKGEPEFRQMEIEMLKHLINSCKEDAIISTGGGTPCFNNAMELMNKYGITVWLDAKIEDLYSNITHDNPDRPLFNGIKKEELMAKLEEMNGLRQNFYGQSVVKVSIYRGLSPDLFTKRLHLSTFA